MVFTDKIVPNDIIISLLNMHQSKQMLKMIFMTLVCSICHSHTEMIKCSKIFKHFSRSVLKYTVAVNRVPTEIQKHNSMIFPSFSMINNVISMNI